MPFERLGWVLAALLLLLVLVQSARLARLRSAPRRRFERARERGRAGEAHAAAVLERAGYRIDAVQPELEYTILCDGAPYPVAVRADLLVSRAARRYVAEIKTGSSAPRLDTPGTRRQLLEYSMAYAVDGVLLVDMEAERVHEIRFPLHARRSSFWRAALVPAVFVVLAWLLVR